MALFLLRANECDYDEYSGFAVIASSEDQAREIVNKKIGISKWLDPSQVTCVEVDPSGEPSIVLDDFNAG